ncbi:MAG: VWA domain-containing protein [Planctomycetes bacterium]|nr:VWA domain-containing protein [Planctomycetota bacterium]
MNRLRHIVAAIFPRPRRPVAWRQAVPLVAFLVLYAALCVFLEWSDRLLWVRPAMFALMAVTPWVWWLHVAGGHGLSRVRGTVALLVRLSLVGLFVMLLAEPRAVRTRDELAVVYVVDLSDSIGDDSVEKALEFVAGTVYGKPPKDAAGLVVFGRNASVELPPRESFPLDEGIALNSRVARDATNLEEALSLAAALLPSDTAGRIVLVSDGSETEGSLARVLDDLKAAKVPVDVVPVSYAYDDEVWLEELDLPRFVKIGEDYEATVVLSSLKAGRGELVLSENGQPVHRLPVDYKPGKNRYDLPIKLRGAGFYEYAATIVPDDRKADSQERNNRVANHLYIAGDGKVLLVTDPDGDDRDWELLQQALEEGERQVEVASAYEFPRDALSLMPYDAIVFVNVPADMFDAVQFRAVRDAVKDLGIGFLMVGGPNSFGPGGYHRTAIEEALPVSMDVSKKKILPKGALAIILHTCEFPEGNTWAKRITKEAMRVLGAQDEVGVLLYDWQGGEKWLFPLTPAAQYDELIKKVNGAEPGDMPFFGSTMQMGLAGLKASDAAMKHMVIITDGDPQPPTPALLKDFVDTKVTVSLVAVFPHAGKNSPDIPKMQSIANITGGRFYYPSDPNQLPGIFIKEAKTLNRNMIQNKTVAPELGYPSPVLKGIDGLPRLHGYVLTTPKPRSETVLRAPLDEDDQVDPLLAIWQHGLGKAAAFTSDLSPRWGAEWLQWEKFRAFVKQLMIHISRVQREGHLRLWSYTSGSEGVIVVEDFHPDDTFLEVEAVVSGPREHSERVRLKQIGPRRYQATIPLWGKGNYQVLAAGSAGDRTDRAQGGFIVSYSPEYLRFRSNPIVLEEIAAKTGGELLARDAKPEDIYLRRPPPRQSSRPVFDWFLIALACLVPLDVAVRRIQIDLFTLKSLLGLDRKRAPSTETMGALLARKRAVDSNLDARREEASAAGRAVTAVRRPRVEVAPKSQAPQAPTGEKAPDEVTTTSRLLEMKRRRQQEK